MQSIWEMLKELTGTNASNTWTSVSYFNGSCVKI
jgi:hypothetical protein